MTLGDADRRHEDALRHKGEREPKGQTPRDRLVTIVIVLAALIGVTDIIGIGLGFAVRDVQRTQEDIELFQQEGRERGYVSRAQSCRLLRLQGANFPPNDPCLEEVVLRYYDPDEVSPARAHYTRLLCAVLRNQGDELATDPVCVEALSP